MLIPVTRADEIDLYRRWLTAVGEMKEIGLHTLPINTFAQLVNDAPLEHSLSCSVIELSKQKQARKNSAKSYAIRCLHPEYAGLTTQKMMKEPYWDRFYQSGQKIPQNR